MKLIPLFFLFSLIYLSGCSSSQEPSTEILPPDPTPSPTPPLYDGLPAFPGAEGYGAYAVGGRGGRIYYVTNLNDSGTGSLRAAIEAEGRRIVLFKVSGTIYLQSQLELCNPYITIAGQTAPGDGICIANSTFFIYGPAHDVIIRGLRIRHGDMGSLPGNKVDAIAIDGSRPDNAVSDVIIDHCSLSWAIDETFQVWDYAKNITLQWSMITESLDDSRHPEGPHGYGVLSMSAFDSGGVSIHHNLIAHHQGRNPKFSGNHWNENTLTLHDFQNNVVYNYGKRAGMSGKQSVPVKIRVNFMNNYYKPGPDTRPVALDRMLFIQYQGNAKYYLANNFLFGQPSRTADNWSAVRYLETDLNESDIRIEAPFNAPPVTIYPANQLYEKVLANAGCIHPVRDAVDNRIVSEVRSGGGKIIDSQSEVGGWPILRSAAAPTDTDNDGMPDDWETVRGLDPNDPADGKLDRNGDGYSNVEEYINSLIPVL